MEESIAPKISETRFHAISTVIFQISTLFVIFFNFIYFCVIPLKALILDLIDPWAAFFDILVGLSITILLLVIYRLCSTRIGALLQPIILVYWNSVPGNWLLQEWEDMQWDFANTFIIAWIIWGILLANALLGGFKFLCESYRLRKRQRSVFWGSLVQNFQEFWKIKMTHSTQNPKYLFVRGLGIVLFAISLTIPGFLSFTNIYEIPIEITPQDYDITYNFWAIRDYDGNYTTEWQQKYHIGPGYYNTTILQELNQHKVNMDFMFSQMVPKDVGLLKEWEARCPDITYRIVLAPAGNISTLYGIVKFAADLMVESELNGTLNGFKGFCFDIEGDAFRYRFGFDTFEESTAMWNLIFDYIEQKSIERGKTIDMECVSDPWTCHDGPFDGDDDIQRHRGMNAYIPERFTIYAPMIYRCWYGGEIPWGAPQDPTDPWDTSYSVYASLYSLQKAVSDEKLGFYIGITNTSCYGRDMPQPEPYTWPVNQPNTGFTNLMRDVLIAKHFGIKELTFFLVWTWIENNYSMGGVFESYGIDFLDRVNKTINTNPPDSFNIYYSQANAENSEVMTDDWLYDMRRWDGIAEIIGLWVISIFFPVWAYQKRKSPKIE